MKKTLTINISGIIFHIDEDAFELLSNYLGKIKNSFANNEGYEEIIADIEARIAELLKQKISESKQVITISDIEEIIKIMGKPEEIGADTDTKESGIANEKYHGAKRLYRDPDNKVIGGVCSGIASYFNIDPVWIRIGFIAALLLFGSGPLLYLILWIVVPEAKTTAEKLEMKGEPVNISNIEKSIQDEINHLKSKLKDLKNEAQSTYKQNLRKYKNSTASEKLAGFLLMLLKYCIRFAAVVIGIVFIVLGIFLITGFAVSFFKTDDFIWVSSIGSSNISIPYFLQILVGNPAQITLAIIGLILLLGIPLIMLIYNGIKLIFGIKSRVRIIGISALSLWFSGLILCGIITLTTLNSFSTNSVIAKKNTLLLPKDNTLKVYIKNNERIDSLSQLEERPTFGKWNMISRDGKNIFFGTPQLTILKSENENYQLIIYTSSKGNNKGNAQYHIKRVKYNFVQNDTSLILDPFFTLAENEKWRYQNVKILLKVPVWKSIYLDQSTKNLLVTDSYKDEYYEQELYGRKWIMTENGLKEFNGLTTVILKDSIQNKKDTSYIKPSIIKK